MTTPHFRDESSAPVSSRPTTAVETDPLHDGHHIECDVRRRLMTHPSLSFTSLVIRRIRDGVCLQGVLETPADPDEIRRLATQVDGVDRVLNRLVQHRPPKKG